MGDLFLQSEEFFRVVSTHPSGVPISVANCISNPSFGSIDGLKVIIHRHCTPFLTAAVVAGFLAIATSTLAPAARKSRRVCIRTQPLNAFLTVTVQTFLFDGDLQAFAVGAVGVQSVYK
jgi:hypothetical protein